MRADDMALVIVGVRSGSLKLCLRIISTCWLSNSMTWLLADRTGVTSRNQHDELVSYSVVSVTGTSFTRVFLCAIKLFDQWNYPAAWLPAIVLFVFWRCQHHRSIPHQKNVLVFLGGRIGSLYLGSCSAATAEPNKLGVLLCIHALRWLCNGHHCSHAAHPNIYFYDYNPQNKS